MLNFFKHWMRSKKLLSMIQTHGLLSTMMHEHQVYGVIYHLDEVLRAGLDGDRYSSVLDSMEKIYHKMVSGGIIIIDDCGWEVTPGCQKALQDFLVDKRETLQFTGYPDKNMQFGKPNHGGKIVII